MDPDPYGGYGLCEICGSIAPLNNGACAKCEKERPYCDVCMGPCRGRHVFYDERWGCPAGAGRLEGASYCGPDFDLIDAVIELLRLFKAPILTGFAEPHYACPPSILGGLIRGDAWVQRYGSIELQIRTKGSSIAEMGEYAFLEKYSWDDALMRDAGSCLCGRAGVICCPQPRHMTCLSGDGHLLRTARSPAVW